MTTDLPGHGTVCMLTTYGPDETLHSRPVTIWAGSCPGEVLLITEPDAAKIAEIALTPEVSLGGPWADGWWSAEGGATLDPDATRDTLRAAGLPTHQRATVLRITLSRLRRWTVTGTGPWDNTYDERVFGDV